MDGKICTISSLSMLDLAICRWCRFPTISASRSRTAISSQPFITASPPTARAEYNARGGYLAFLGRISPEKRPDRAIEIARAVGVPLKIAAKVDRVDEAYFHEQIAPLLSGRVSSLSAKSMSAARASFLAGPWPSCFRSTGRSRSDW